MKPDLSMVICSLVFLVAALVFTGIAFAFLASSTNDGSVDCPANSTRTMTAGANFYGKPAVTLNNLRWFSLLNS